MPSHGPQFDAFPAQSGTPHGPQQDEGYGAAPTGSAHGAQFDTFSHRPSVTSHGARWDEFGWQDMPTSHGSMFDEGFASASTDIAHDNAHGHGTWFDTFRGGAQVRFIEGGADYEGTVIDCTTTHCTVERRDGTRRELDYGQITLYRATSSGAPSRETKSGGMSRPTTTAPAVNVAASGRTPVKPEGGVFANKTDAELLEVLKARTGAAMPAKAPRKGLPKPAAQAPKGASWDAVWGSKPKAYDHPVPSPAAHQENHAKRVAGAATKVPHVQSGGFSCTDCGHSDFRTHKIAGKDGHNTSLAMKGCVKCGLMHPTRIGKTAADDGDVAKGVDTTETAIQAKDQEDDTAAKGRFWCGRCKHTCRKVEKGGRCPTCGGETTAAPKKDDDTAKRASLTEVLDVLKGMSGGFKCVNCSGTSHVPIPKESAEGTGATHACPGCNRMYAGAKHAPVAHGTKSWSHMLNAIYSHGASK